MSCFTKITHNLRGGKLDEYRKDLGDPRKLSTSTHYSSSSYTIDNHNYATGIASYNSIKSTVESYVGGIGCPHVNDLAATYNAIHEALGISYRVLNPTEMNELSAKRIAASYKKYGNPVNVSKSRNKEMIEHHQLQGRGVSGGRVLVNVQEIKQRVEREIIETEKKLEIERIENQRIENERLAVEAQKIKMLEIEKQNELVELKRIEHEKLIESQRVESERIQTQNLLESEKQIEVDIQNKKKTIATALIIGGIGLGLFTLSKRKSFK